MPRKKNRVFDRAMKIDTMRRMLRSENVSALNPGAEDLASDAVPLEGRVSPRGFERLPTQGRTAAEILADPG